LLETDLQVVRHVKVEDSGHADGHLFFFREKDGALIIGDVPTNMNLLTTFTGLHLPLGMFTTNHEFIKKIKSVASASYLFWACSRFG